MEQFIPVLVWIAICGFALVKIKKFFAGAISGETRTVSELKYEISELRDTIEKLSERIEELERYQG